MNFLTLSLNEPIEKLNEKLTANLNSIGHLKLFGFRPANQEKVRLIANFLKQDKTVTLLTLTSEPTYSDDLLPSDPNGSPSENDLMIICSALADNANITELTIRNASLTESGLEAIASMLVAQEQGSNNPKKLRTIRLISSNALSCQALGNLGIILTHNVNHLEFLDLTGSGLDDNHADVLTGLACSLPNLRAIKLDVNRITDSGAQRLLDIPELTATKVILESDRLSDVTKLELKRKCLEEKKADTFLKELHTARSTFFSTLPKEVLIKSLEYVDLYDQDAIYFLTNNRCD